MRVDSRLASLCAALRGRALLPADWEVAIGDANRSLTICQFAKAFAGQSDLPTDVQIFFNTVLARNEERNRRLSVQLKEAGQCLNSVGIVPVLLKGSAFLSGPDRIPDRLMSDLDLMVSDREYPEAVWALKGLGYAVDEEDAFATVLGRSADVGLIDLHRSLKSRLPKLDYAHLVSRSSQEVLCKASFLRISSAGQAAVLIAHDQLQSRDYWRGLLDLRHCVDILHLAAESEPIDWCEVSSFFPAGRPRRALLTHLLTLEALLGLEIPANLRGATYPKLQLGRRLIQARFRGLSDVLTAVAIIVDPPWIDRANLLVEEDGFRDRPASQARVFAREIRRCFYPRVELGKY